jgi:hydrogenase maturation protease
MGNPLRGDDGVGAFVLGALRALGPLPTGVTLHSAEGGDVLEPLTAETWSRVVIIDAADLGQAPGAWMRLGLGALAVARLRGSTHRLGLVEALAMAKALGRDPERVAIFAVQPESTGWQAGLSQAVLRALPDLLQAVLWEMSASVPGRGRMIGTRPQEQATHVRLDQCV